MQAEITTDGKRIIAQIPYANGQGKIWAKKVPGARALWDKSVEPNKFLGWSYPLTMDTCRTFRRVFGAYLRVSTVLADWASEEIKRENQLEDLRAGDKAVDLDRVRALTPQLYMAIDSRKYQIAGAGFLVTARQALLGDEPGLGKTLQTLAAIVQSGSQKVLVACPKTACRTVWARETNQWAPHIAPFVAQGSHAEREQVMRAFEEFPYSPKMLIINTEMIRMVPEICPDGPLRNCKWGETDWHQHRHNVAEWQWIFDQTWDTIVLDESHNLLASTKNVQSKHITQGRYGAMKLRRRLASEGMVLALSGTPFRSKLERAWGTLNWLRPDVFSSFWRYAETHFEVSHDGWGKTIGTKDINGKVVAVPKDEKAFQQAMRPYFLARTKAEAAPDLPPINYMGSAPVGNPDGLKGVWLDMDPKQAKAYHDIRENGMARLANGDTMYATGVLAEITRMRQFACSYMRSEPGQPSYSHDPKTAGFSHLEFFPELPSNKLEWILEYLREREGNDGKVVIASSFTRFIEFMAAAIQKEFKTPVLTLTGKTTDKQRQVMVHRFNEVADDPCRVAIINTQAGGTAITLDRFCDDMILTDMPWVSDDEDQVTSRIHRVSRIHQVNVYRLFSVGTVDEWMAGLTEAQREALQTAKPKNIYEQVLEVLAG